MGRRFIAKKNKNIISLFKLIIFVIVCVFIFLKLMSIQIFKTNTNLVMYTMESSNHLINNNISYVDKLNNLSKFLTKLNLKLPNTLFKNNFIFIKKEEISENSMPLIFFEEFMKDFNEIINSTTKTVSVENKEPKVYIYNTHQTEEYVMENNSIHNLNPDVYSASYYLKELLEKKGIKTIVEDGNIKDYLLANNLNYDDSYIASRNFLESAVLKYPSIEIFIDLHRDALTHDAATVTFEGKNYAKILFVVGLDHENYKPNLDFANELNSLVLNDYGFLTRGVLTKSGPLVNGIYNQDLSSRVILLEVGGNESTIDEVTNTLELISNIIYKKIGDKVE